MSKQNETGHAKNLANFLRLIECCRGFEKAYNPSIANITLGALQELYDKASKSIKALSTAETSFDKATNARASIFENTNVWATRIVNAFDITETNDKAKEDIRGINRKIQGTRAEKIDPPKKGATPPPEGEGGKHISVSQLSYDNQVKHFETLLEALVQDGNYKPNEQDIAIDAISKKIDEMINANKKITRPKLPITISS